MKYDFDAEINRRNTNSLKWNIAENELPLWVADMDFMVAPEILEAIKNRAEHGVFGYSVLPEEWYSAIIGWWKNRYGFEIKQEWLMFCTGVIPAISSIVRKITTVGENVLIQTPVYNHFFSSILNNGRNVLENKLEYSNSEYSINFEDLEQKLKNPQTTLMLLCNPHNPVGKIWDKETLERIGNLCFENNVIVLSDEIHCDLTDPGIGYTPFASISEKCRQNSIICISPTKTFNLAGLQSSAVIAPNKVLRHKVNRGLNTDEIAEPNAFAAEAASVAFSKGAEWLDELRQYIFENKRYVSNFLASELPQIKLVLSQATYLLWLDCTSFCDDSEKFAQLLRENTGLFLSTGSIYGGNGRNFLRMNIACPIKTIKDALNRLKSCVLAYEKRADK